MVTRRILRIPRTFIDRLQTKQIVREKTSQYNVDVTKISDTWRKQKLKSFGHILRAEDTDPLRQVILDFRTYSRTFRTRRGRPRMDCQDNGCRLTSYQYQHLVEAATSSHEKGNLRVEYLELPFWFLSSILMFSWYMSQNLSSILIFSVCIDLISMCEFISQLFLLNISISFVQFSVLLVHYSK